LVRIVLSCGSVTGLVKRTLVFHGPMDSCTIGDAVIMINHNGYHDFMVSPSTHIILCVHGPTLPWVHYRGPSSIVPFCVLPTCLVRRTRQSLHCNARAALLHSTRNQARIMPRFPTQSWTSGSPIPGTPPEGVVIFPRGERGVPPPGAPAPRTPPPDGPGDVRWRWEYAGSGADPKD
jgi:hypothetical protein